MKYKLFFAIVGVAALSAVSLGQGFRGGMGMGGAMGASPSALVRRDDVKKELNLTDDQKGKIDELVQGQQAKMQEAMQASGITFGGGATPDMEAIGKVFEKVNAQVGEEISKVLNADQQKRLKEIRIQIAGTQAITMADIQKDLGMSDEQKAKAADLQKKQRQAMMEVFQKARSQEIEFSEVPNIMKKNNEVMDVELTKILTQAQKDKLKDMAGKTFVQTDKPRGFGGGGGGGI